MAHGALPITQVKKYPRPHFDPPVMFLPLAARRRSDSLTANWLLEEGEIIKAGEDLRGQVTFSDARGKMWIRDGFQPPEHYVPGKNEHLVPES